MIAFETHMENGQIHEFVPFGGYTFTPLVLPSSKKVWGNAFKNSFLNL